MGSLSSVLQLADGGRHQDECDLCDEHTLVCSSQKWCRLPQFPHYALLIMVESAQHGSTNAVKANTHAVRLLCDVEQRLQGAVGVGSPLSIEGSSSAADPRGKNELQARKVRRLDGMDLGVHQEGREKEEERTPTSRSHARLDLSPRWKNKKRDRRRRTPISRSCVSLDLSPLRRVVQADIRAGGGCPSLLFFFCLLDPRLDPDHPAILARFFSRRRFVDQPLSLTNAMQLQPRPGA